MSKIFFIADTHFGDKNIIKYEGRPFKDVEEMNNVLIENWNNTVGSMDTIFVVGDFISDRCYLDIIHRLKGKIKIIAGNHDIPFVDDYRRYGNVEVFEYPIILDNFWMVSHEPLYITENSPYANIFGHIHNNPMYLTVSTRSYCVCVERNGYKPICFDYIKERVRKENK
jgi:calcineurin-like phosphoesterase family protein